jgi:OOP family OmpA-OmpF porin
MWLAFAALGIAQAASADDSGWYVGASLGIADTPNTGLSFTDVPSLTGKTKDETSWGFAAAYRFNPNLAIELGYVNLGEVTAELTDATGLTDARAAIGFSAEGVTLAMIGTFPLGKWEPYLKAGVFFSRNVFEYSGGFSGRSFGGRNTNDDKDALYGIGLRYALSEHLRIYLDSTLFPAVGESDTGGLDYVNTSLGATWQF